MESKEPTNKPFKKGKLALLFDVDGTLTESRKVIKENMKNTLKKINEYSDIDLYVVGGSDLVKIKEQLANTIDYIKMCFTENGLVNLDEKREIHKINRIKDHIGNEGIKEFVNFCLRYIADLDIPVKTGTFIEMRTGLINVSPIGRNCTQEERNAFNEYNMKNHVIEKFRDIVIEKFAEKYKLKIAIGGQISFDVFPVGWDKTFCLQFLKDYENIVFFGDKGYAGGNDYEIMIDDRITKGIRVKNPEDTIEWIHKIIEEFHSINKEK